MNAPDFKFRDLRFAIKAGLCSALSHPIGESIGCIEGPVKRHLRDCFDTMIRKNPEIQSALDELYRIVVEGKQ